MRRMDWFEIYAMWFVMTVGFIAVPLDIYASRQQSNLIYALSLFESIVYLVLVQCVFACTQRMRAGNNTLSWYYVGYLWAFSYMMLVLSVRTPTITNILLTAIEACMAICVTYLTAEQKAQNVGKQ